MTETQTIDEQIARKLGWVQDHGIWDRPGSSFRVILPPYSTDIAVAWEIVEKMKQVDRMIILTSPMGDKHWVCQVEKDGGLLVGAGADTAPLAICRAFLKLP